MELNRQTDSEQVPDSQHSIRNMFCTYFAKEKISNIFHDAGITVQGKNEWDIQVHDERFFNRVLLKWSLGFGESYMDGWWDTNALDQLIYRLYT
jgi:cyclopropane-fatty-acyl-phospholipid synthase